MASSLVSLPGAAAREIAQAAIGPAVEFSAVTKSYDETLALDDISVEIRAGQTLALLGPNGAGKSTAINLMLGLLNPTSGSVVTLGSSPRAAVAGGRIGAMLQSSGFPANARVGELVAFARSLYPRPESTAEIIARAGLAGLEGRSVETLSGGEAQRLRFALAVSGDPELIFLDEPTVAMDVETRRAFWASMREFATDGKTIVFATHYLDEADAVADRIIVLDHGRIVADGSGSSIKAATAGQIVRFTVPSSAVAPVAALRALPRVTDVEVAGDRVTVKTTDSDAVVHWLFASGTNARGLEVSGGALEDAFVALTTHKPTEESSR